MDNNKANRNRQKLPSLTPRLSAAARFIRNGAVLADIGTDHAHLVMYAVRNGLCSKAYACDAAKKPLDKARKNLDLYGCANNAEVILSNGLENVPPDADDIVIAGMGGELIASILENAGPFKSPDKRFILQPMTNAAKLRRFLADSGFCVLSQALASEPPRIYVCLLVHYTGVPYDLSPFNISVFDPNACKDDKLYIEFVKKERHRYASIAKGLAASSDINERRRSAQARDTVRLLDEYLGGANYADS